VCRACKYLQHTVQEACWQQIHPCAESTNQSEKSPAFSNPWHAQCNGGVRRRAWKRLSLCRPLNATALTLECHPSNTQLGLVPVSQRGLLPEFEEQTRTRGSQSRGVSSSSGCIGGATTPQPSILRLIRYTLRLTLPFFSPSFFHTISLSSAFTSACWAD
jgi:hypothetical protein